MFPFTGVIAAMAFEGVNKARYVIYYLINYTHSPTVSLTAASCPFFLLQTYFPLLAFRATLPPSHSMSNIVLGALLVNEYTIY